MSRDLRDDGPPDPWRRLAESQDRALRDPGPLEDVRRDLLARVAAAAPRRRRGRRVLLGLTGVAMAAGAVALWAASRPLRFQIGGDAGGPEGLPGTALEARADSDLPLRFSDGSTVTFRPGSAGRVFRLTGAGAEVRLDRGRLESNVRHTGRARWTVHAGPFRIRVTGTRFTTTWRPPATLVIELHEGSVIADGALLGAGVSLRAGQRLRVALDTGVVRTEPLAPQDPPAAEEKPRATEMTVPEIATAASPDEAKAGPEIAPAAEVNPPITAAGQPAEGGKRRPTETRPGRPTANAHQRPHERLALAAAVVAPTVPPSPGAPEQAPMTSPAPPPPVATAPSAAPLTRPPVAEAPPGGTTSESRDRSWLALADQGDHAGALAAAKRMGFATLCGQLDARGLLALGDVARHAGAPDLARDSFHSLVRRFPQDPLASDAAFSLGRLAFDSRRMPEAITWFERYLTSAPDGPLANEAAGRLVEAAARSGDAEARRRAALAYLQRLPRGPHAALARRLLRPSAEAP